MNPAPPIRLRRWRPLLMAAAMLVALASAWVADHLRPRDAFFARRKGTVVAVAVTPDTPSGRNFAVSTVQLTGSTGLRVTLRVLRPEGPTRPRPLVVILGGHRTGRDAVDLVGDPGSMVVAALDYPYSGPEKPRGWREILGSIPAIQRGLLDTPPAVLLALDWLAGQPWVDPARIELVGVSLGVPFAAVAGALDPRFRRVWLIHGAGENRRLLDYNLRSRIGSGWIRSGTAGLLYLLAYGPTLEPTRWVPRIAPRSVVIIAASEDERLPRELVERLFQAAGQPKELLWTEGRHIEPERRVVLQQILATVRARVLETPEGASNK